MDAITSLAVDKLKTADQITSARLRLMSWRAEMERQFPGDQLFIVMGNRLAAAITARAIVLGLETL